MDRQTDGQDRQIDRQTGREADKQTDRQYTDSFKLACRFFLNRKLERRFDLFYYDGFAQQDDVIRLTVDTTSKSTSLDDDHTPPLEHCIRTKYV